MFQLRLIITEYEIDVTAYNRALRAAIEQQMKLAGREFAKAAIVRIPIRSGFAAGAFGTLADLVGDVEARFNPGIQAQREYYYGSGSKILKTPANGRLFATPAEQVFKWIGETFVFTYDININYFRSQDVSSGPSPSAPWQAFRAGELAFNNYMETIGVTKLPKISDYVREKVTRIG